MIFGRVPDDAPPVSARRCRGEGASDALPRLRAIPGGADPDVGTGARTAEITDDERPRHAG